jgi:hypothetical protein
MQMQSLIQTTNKFNQVKLNMKFYLTVFVVIATGGTLSSSQFLPYLQYESYETGSNKMQQEQTYDQNVQRSLTEDFTAVKDSGEFCLKRKH